MNVRLLLDENLSPWVADRLRVEDGIDAIHVRERNLLGASDAQVLEVAYTEDRLVVTTNVADFVKLARARELHPGVILFEDGGLLRFEQLRVTRAAVAALQAETDLVNRVLRIWSDATTLFESIPPQRAANGTPLGARKSEAPNALDDVLGLTIEACDGNTCEMHFS